MSEWSDYIDDYCESMDEADAAYASLTEPFDMPLSDDETVQSLEYPRNNSKNIPQQNARGDDEFLKSLLEDN